MPLHPLLQHLIDLSRDDPPPHTLGIEQARRRLVDMVARLERSPLTLGEVRDLHLPPAAEGAPSVRARLYQPLRSEEAPPALLLYFHGGGWCVCDIDTHDGQCRRLCHESGCAVLSVDYRLSPESPFPDGFHDCLAATRWAQAQGAALGVPSGRFFVCGDSAGGNLAAAVSHTLRDAGGPQPLGQVLIYPAVNDLDRPTASYASMGEGVGLSMASARVYWRAYLARCEGRVPVQAAPLTDTRFDDLPPTFVITAEYDMLRDEGQQYADLLRAAGVPVQTRHEAGMNHGFMAFEAMLPQAGACWVEIGRWVRAAIP